MEALSKKKLKPQSNIITKIDTETGFWLEINIVGMKIGP